MKVLLLCLLALLPAVLSTPIATGVVRGFTATTSQAAENYSFKLRFQGTETDLTSGFTATRTGNDVVVTDLATGRYTWSDDGGASWSNISTDCLTPDVPPIVLNTQASATASVGGRLRLHLVFLENHRYYSISYKYQGGASNCNSSVSGTGDNYQAWVRTASNTACSSSQTDYTQDFNDALIKCNYYRDETSADQTVFNATIIITTVDTGIVIRKNRYERTLETAVVIKIGFQTNVSAVNDQPSIFGSRIVYSAVTQQLWNTNTFTATVTVITSVQWPYQLYQTDFTNTIGEANKWSTRTSVPSPQDDATDINNQALTRAKCFSSTGATSSGATPQAAGQICNQYWTITLARSDNCGGSSSLTLSGAWRIDFGVTCPAIFTGSCATPNPGTDYITFTTNSTNYCPQIIENNNLNTATLATYQKSDYTVAQNQFVFGTTTYFEATINSPIKMSNVAVEFVYLTNGGTVPATTAYFSRPFTSSGAFFEANAAPGTYETSAGCGEGRFNTTGGMTVTDNADGNSNEFTKKVRFTLLWNPCTSAATGDNPQPTTVQVNMRIRYQNQNTAKLTFTKKIGLEAGVETGVASTTVGVQAPSAAASTSSSSSAMTVIGVVAGVVGVTALLVGMTVYMLRRNRAGKSEQQVASVQLQSSP